MKKLVSATLTISALAASASAIAQGANAYIGGSFGFARANIDCAGATACDKDGTAASVYGGYRFNPWFAGEVRYFHAGKATIGIGGISADFKADAIGLVGALSAPVSTGTGWTATTRLGVMNSKSVVDVSGGGSSGSLSDRNVQPYFGVEFGYKVNQWLTGTFGWEFTRGKLNVNQGSVSLSETANINALSAGLRVDF